jgi:hypothetical protein
MKKMPNEFHKALRDLRDSYGKSEYKREELVPHVAELVKQYTHDGYYLLCEAARAFIERAEKAEDRADEGMFPYDAHIALGEGKRIRRSSMTFSHHFQRKAVIDNNKIATDRAWAEETGWLNPGIEALKDEPLGTKRSDVLDENGETQRKKTG